MADVNKEAVEFWNSLKPMIDEEIKVQTRGMVQRRKMKVTTAPSLNTNKIGVTEPFGPEMLIPFTTNLISATVGDVVWVEFMYGMTNAFASMFASADEKDWDVAGNLSVIGNAGIGGDLGVSGSTSLQNTTVNGVLEITPRRCYATLSSAGWYRVCKTADISGTIIDFSIGRPYGSSPAEAHRISFYVVGGGKSTFLGEKSDSNTLLVDKIRCTYGGGYMYFDIHYTASSSNQVLVYFDVYGKGQENQSTVAEQLQAVADSPSGETVLVEHTFDANMTTTITAGIQAGGTVSIPNAAKYKTLELIVNTSSSNPAQTRGAVVTVPVNGAIYLPVAAGTTVSYMRVELSSANVLSFLSSGISGLYIIAINAFL